MGNRRLDTKLGGGPELFVTVWVGKFHLPRLSGPNIPSYCKSSSLYAREIGGNFSVGTLKAPNSNFFEASPQPFSQDKRSHAQPI